MYAIAKNEGLTHGGIDSMRILSCPDETLKGRCFLNDERKTMIGETALIKFSPEDQFCNVVNLAQVCQMGADCGTAGK